MSYSSVSRRMSRGVPMLLALGIVPCTALSALAGTIHVPSQMATIQAGIDAAVNGDTVVVASGTYLGPGNRNIDLKGKAITLKSASGAKDCIINAGGTAGSPQRVFILQGNEPSTAKVDGFTITGGYASNGGGVYFKNTNASVRNCVIAGNSASGAGGGVFSESAGTPSVFNCTIKDNLAATQGGGVCVSAADFRVENCLFKSNDATSGGAVATLAGSPLVVNCLMIGNAAASSGGGAYLLAGRMMNCTISTNAAPAGSAVFGSANAPIGNSILWSNSGGTLVANNPPITYSIVQGGYTGAGNRNADPKFVKPSADDYKLNTKSPAVDSASNALVPVGIKKDLAGVARFINDYTITDTGQGTAPIVDMGCYEKGIPKKNPSQQTLPGPPG